MKNVSKKEDAAYSSFDNLIKSPSPRFIKTHLPFHLLPKQIRTGQKNPKMIYLIRDAKDVCVSNFSIYLLAGGFIGTFDEFCCLFLSGKSKFINNSYKCYFFFADPFKLICSLLWTLLGPHK